MPERVYESFRGALAALADDAWLARLSASSVGSSADGHGPWKRVYGRFEPEREPFAALVLESQAEPQTPVLLEAFARPPDTAGTTSHDEAVGWIRRRPFWSDESLPSLPAVLSKPGRPHVVRYRPHRQCTIRFDRGGGRLFAKVFPDQRGGRIHAEEVALREASARGEIAFRVARALAWDGAERTLWNEELGGAPVADRVRSARGPELAERMGRALASLARSSLAPAERVDGAAQLRRTSQHGDELCRQVPRLSRMVGVILQELSRLHRRPSRRRPRPIHGAPHVHQWLDDERGLGLLDFDRFCLGDPERDVATFLTEMDFENPARVPVAEINRRFLAGYESGGGELDGDLLLAYCVHKRVEKALKALRAVRADGDLRAERRCAQAAALLEGVRA